MPGLLSTGLARFGIAVWHNKGLLRVLLAALTLILCSCASYPDAYPPPEQRHPIETGNPSSTNMMIDMSDPDAASHFVKDIENAEPGAQWRWARQNPTLKILAIQTSGLKLVSDFSLWDIAFKQTGPVELSFFVNDRLLDAVRYDSPGYKHFEKPVPSDWLSTDVESTVSVRIDKLWVSPTDGEKFGFILSRIGFTR